MMKREEFVKWLNTYPIHKSSCVTCNRRFTARWEVVQDDPGRVLVAFYNIEEEEIE